MIKAYQHLVTRLSPWQIGLLAAIVYGFWAGWVNSEYGHAIALKTGLIQASYAFVSTAIITVVAAKLLACFGFSRIARSCALLVSWLIMVAIPVLLHAWQQTPDILEAILPGIVIGSLYLSSYCFAKQFNG